MALETRSNRRRRRRIALVAVVVVLLGAVAFLVTFRTPLFRGNFGVVDAGRVFRSAQPRANLAKTIESRKIASILNLRGGSSRDDWYVAEVVETDRHGVDFYDFPMSATRRPSRRELLTLLDLYDRCRYPLLIHCKSGADRTGLAVGLYEMSRLGKPPADAVKSFSLAYAHVAIGGPERLHEPFVEYDRWLRGRNLTHAPALLRAWVENEYADDSLGDAPFPLLPGPRARIASRAEPRRTR